VTVPTTRFKFPPPPPVPLLCSSASIFCVTSQTHSFHLQLDRRSRRRWIFCFAFERILSFLCTLLSLFMGAFSFYEHSRDVNLISPVYELADYENYSNKFGKSLLCRISSGRPRPSSCSHCAQDFTQ
jgi:hypothetical protein